MQARICILLGLWLMGQSLILPAQRTCGHDAVLADLIAHEPGFAERHAAWQREMGRLIEAAHQGTRRVEGVITIPVVVHVIYRTPLENISDAQIQSQIAILTQDFRRINVDAANTPAIFGGVAADTEIEFCLAQFDPMGAPSTGITRTQTTQTSWSGDHAVKYAAQGGHDGWPRDAYLNIWVCNLSGGLLGYATPPSVADATRDGVVIGYNYFGNTGPLNPSFNMGRTSTHEVGHWLGLAHTWGSGGCTNDDNIPDTPIQTGPNFGCPTYPSESCSNAALGGDMFMNYMDYCDDICFNLFTNDQKAVMRGLFDPGNVRSGLLISGACVNPDFNKAALLLSSGQPDTICGVTFSAPVRLRNVGLNAITSASIVQVYDGIVIDTLEFTGTLTPTLVTNLAFPPLPVTAGPHTVRYYSTGVVNETEDPDLSNDTVSVSFFVRSNQGLVAPYLADFETGFIQNGWSLRNPDSAITWRWTDTAAWSGAYSVVMEAFDYTAIGQFDDFTLPQMDISQLANPQLTFYRAYARFAANSGFNDELEIWASTDCGDTYQQIWREVGDDLVSAPPVSYPFVPQGASQWRGEVVDLSAFAGATGLSLRFRFINQYENNLYLDAINVLDSVNVMVSAPAPLQAGWRVMPNPSQGVISLLSDGSPHAPATATLFDPAGRALRQHRWQPLPGQAMRWDLSELPAGLYLLQVETDQGTWMEKLVMRK
jgi:hypothetical protein